MYKIYINENLLKLADSAKLKANLKETTALIAPYTGNKKMLLSYIDMLEKTNRYKEIIIHFSDIKILKENFKSLYRKVYAGGGIVQNEKGEILVIKRLGHWDLPKGKLDEGETIKEASTREVIEETGIDGVALISKLGKTRHSYKTKNGTRALKITSWYIMKAQNQKLTPQEAESITKAVWKSPDFINNLKEPIYKSILDLIKKFNKKQRKMIS